MKKISIAIDGPASSGKSTIAKELAKALKSIYIDTGAMYRGVTLSILRESIDISNPTSVEQILDTIDLHFQLVNGEQHLFLNDENINDEIRSIEVTENVSEVSAIARVRERMVELQRKMAEKASVVMDGRDIGTVVLPNADYKFFFTASAKVRALRRYNENIAKGMTSQTVEEIEAAIKERDYLDSTREHSPLKQAEDAELIDTGELTVIEVRDLLLKKINESQGLDV